MCVCVENPSRGYNYNHIMPKNAIQLPTKSIDKLVAKNMVPKTQVAKPLAFEVLISSVTIQLLM